MATKVDDDIYERYKNMNIHYSDGYARVYLNWKKQTALHRLVNNTPIGLRTDHINRDTLDNRRCNLRTVTASENGRNTKLSKRNSSGHKGVCWDKSIGLWKAHIIVNRKQIYLGAFKEKIDAVSARRKGELAHFGEFA